MFYQWLSTKSATKLDTHSISNKLFLNRWRNWMSLSNCSLVRRQKRRRSLQINRKLKILKLSPQALCRNLINKQKRWLLLNWVASKSLKHKRSTKIIVIKLGLKYWKNTIIWSKTRTNTFVTCISCLTTSWNALKTVKNC